MHIHLEPITAHNIGDCLRLHVAPHQKYFVASNTVSLIQSLVEPAFVPRAIYAGEQMVGFVMYGRDPESGQDWIVRLMVDARYQGRGYGHAGLLAALDVLGQQPGSHGTFVSYRPEDLAAAFTYAGVGFRPTSVLPDGEIVAERPLTNDAAAPVVAGVVLAAGAATRMGRPSSCSIGMGDRWCALPPKPRLKLACSRYSSSLATHTRRLPKRYRACRCIVS